MKGLLTSCRGICKCYPSRTCQRALGMVWQVCISPTSGRCVNMMWQRGGAFYNAIQRQSFSTQSRSNVCRKIQTTRKKGQLLNHTKLHWSRTLYQSTGSDSCRYKLVSELCILESWTSCTGDLNFVLGPNFAYWRSELRTRAELNRADFIPEL